MDLPNFGEIVETIEATIPDKCRDCPVQCEAMANLAKLVLHKNAMLEYGDNLMGDGGQALEDVLKSMVPEERVEDMTKDHRQIVVDNIDDIDDQIAAKEEEMAGISRSCSGVLRLRAKKAGVTYLVSLCSSNRVNIRGKADHLPAHIKTI
jgi:hypothetical protein